MQPLQLGKHFLVQGKLRRALLRADGHAQLAQIAAIANVTCHEWIEARQRIPVVVGKRVQALCFSACIGSDFTVGCTTRRIRRHAG